MLKVGLTGGYATGKSFVASELERLGCSLIYADKLGHAVLMPEGEAYAPVIENFGPGILSPGGEIDRGKLAAIVFASPELLARLTAVVHPAVFRMEEQIMRDIAATNERAIAVIEAAILIESGRSSAFDRLILTVCDEETQVVRGMKRDGITREGALARISRQMASREKKKFADYIIDTGSPKEQTLQQVHKVFNELKSLEP